jgi:hypothetical protein
MRETAPILAQKFEHAAVFYGSTAEYLDAVLGFVAGGLERADPVLVAVPGPKVGLLRDHLSEQAARVSFTDMTVMGANPAWIIPRRLDERSRKARPAGGRTPRPEMYGFSSGLTSIARPYACSDHDVLPSTRRQLNADVLSAAIERSSLAP